MIYHYLAFFMGLFGSIHCVAMCGPLLIAVQGGMENSWKAILNKIIYQMGRIFTYAWIGLFLGFLGNIAALKGWQSAISLITGGILILIAAFYFWGRNSPTILHLQSRYTRPVAEMMGEWMNKRGGIFIAGALNGLLPCGMVYMALAAAVNAEGPLNSAFFMLLFGLGTMPLLIVFSLLIGLPKNYLRINFQKWIPYMYLVLGIWFILRGSNLDIPYLSPLLHPSGAMNCM